MHRHTMKRGWRRRRKKKLAWMEWECWGEWDGNRRRRLRRRGERKEKEREEEEEEEGEGRSVEEGKVGWVKAEWKD